MSDSNEVSMGFGRFQICLVVADLKTSERFYSGLGFGVIEGSAADGFVVLRKDDCEIGLFAEKTMDGTVLNFRGGNTRAVAGFLASHGHELELNHTNDDGSGSVILRDPDGNALFFDSMPAEIADYAAMRSRYQQLDRRAGE